MKQSRTKKRKLLIAAAALIVAAAFVMPLPGPAGSLPASVSRAHAAGTASAAFDGFAGKRVLIDGDSIQAEHGKYLTVALEELGAASIENHARIGAFLGNKKTDPNSVYFRMRGMTDEEIRSFDCIFLAAGTNDFGAVTNVGKVRVGDPYTFAPRATTTCGGLDTIIRKIHAASPDTKIIVITPMHRFKGWVEFPIPAVTDCDELENRWGSTLADYRNAIAMTALKYPGVSVIDGKQLMTPEEAHSLDCTVDYLHPRSNFARTVIAPRAVRLLQQYVK